MKRKKGSTLSTPVFLYDNNKNQMFEPLNGDPIISSYQKILIASPNQVLTDIIGRERNQLLAQMVEDKDTPEVCFIESALQQLLFCKNATKIKTLSMTQKMTSK